jgi:DNA-binding NarL/FixJ family response regulator
MGSLRTYLVEDSPVIRENLISALEEMVSVDVVGTATGEDAAVQWLGDDGNRCDLMIVDVFLAQGSGLGVLRAAHRRKRPGKLVVLSNYATADIRRKCLELGADRVFDKSNEIEALIAYCLRLSTGDSGVSSAFSVLS